MMRVTCGTGGGPSPESCTHPAREPEELRTQRLPQANKGGRQSSDSVRVLAPASAPRDLLSATRWLCFSCAFRSLFVFLSWPPQAQGPTGKGILGMIVQLS